MTVERRVGSGCTIGWDSTGGTGFVVIATVIDGDKIESKFKTANTSLLSDVAETFAKTSYDPGEFKFTIVYDPLFSEYHSLAANFKLVNAVAPNWQLSFPDNGNGSGATAETFLAHVVGLGREVKKGDFLACDITLKVTGDCGAKTS